MKYQGYSFQTSLAVAGVEEKDSLIEISTILETVAILVRKLRGHVKIVISNMENGAINAEKSKLDVLIPLGEGVEELSAQDGSI